MKPILKTFVHFLSVLIIVAATTFLYWKLYKRPVAGIDDANIYFVYARNAAEGHGFVFNTGGERVEGFTSFLWTLITTAVYTLTSNFEIILLILNVFIISYTLFKGIQLINKLIPWPYFMSPAAILFLSLVLLIPGYIDWTILSLMETGLWSMLIVLLAIQLTTYILTDRIHYLSFYISLSLLVFTRPESILWGLFYVFALLVVNLIKGRIKVQQNRPVITSFVVYIVSIGLLTAFRLAYFNYPLPNTFYAKVSDSFSHNVSTGLGYFLKSCVQTPVLWLILLLSLLSIALVLIKLKKSAYRFNKLNNFDIAQTFVAILSLISIAIPILLGGDHFLFGRFFQPFFPVYYLLFFNIYFYRDNLIPSFRLKRRNMLLPAYLLALLLIPYIYLNTNTHLLSFRKSDSPLKIEFEIAELGRENGEKLNTLFKRIELPSVGVSEAGGFGYAYQGQSIDLLGLNSTLVAHATDKSLTGVKNHSAFSKSAFYTFQPDVFFAHSNSSYFVENVREASEEERDNSFAIQVYRNIFSEAEFQQLYEKILIQDPQSQLQFLTYCHKDFIRTLEQNNYNVIYLRNFQITESMLEQPTVKIPDSRKLVEPIATN